MDSFKKEVVERFGNTKAFQEYEERTANYTKADFSNATEGLDLVLGKFAKCKTEGDTPDSDKAQAIVKELQDFITINFYTCTDEVLKGLAVMYTTDERFKKNIDKHGEGTAEFISNAIEIYCH
ncbi:MAG: TipAS antibiotic-recognition domain-containing protein [Ruminococcus sp.]|nr:TipAS antibiotic-recognition domain-containing protein [Ruminococcus sp.]